MYPIYMQKLLLLPKLNDNEISDINNDPIKENSRTCSSNVMAAHHLVNDELINNECGLLSNKLDSARILVNGLTASWTHVNAATLILITAMYKK